MQSKQLFRKLPIEWMCWMTALILLYFSDPHTHHFTLCPLENMGLEWCPGCGLGRAIALFMHGEIEASFRMHWLGIPAFFSIIHRIYTLSKLTYNHWTIAYYHEQP
ncbi:DUF2752 domain-containing protein [Parapedobacter defluvii]|nr:DUF2752 domain-containing protein [Parapedobacter defluvii]RQP19934.1 MAG: DUF2752 domain-containing protein [Parapedobacter sp.]